MRQQSFKFRKQGGKRKRAGRKPTIPGKPRVRHGARPAADPRLPVQITVRMRPEVPRLRNYELCKTLRRAFVYGCIKDEFRICQFSIQGNHIHLVCEAGTADARARGIQGWAVRVARGINRHAGRSGGVFYDRYHLETLKTPTHVRNALCYVLQNARRHGTRLERRYHGADPFSSAWWFDGWKDESWKDGLDPPEQRTVAEPKSWMLREGWRRSRAGLIAIAEIPAAGLVNSAGRGRRTARRARSVSTGSTTVSTES